VVLKKQTKEPWTFYWEDVKKNGTNAEKWTESLKEVESLNSPLVADFCFQAMYENGCYPILEHYNILFRMLAKFGNLRSMADYYDDLLRSNDFAKPNNETFNHFLKCLIQLGQFYFANKHLEFAKKKKITS